MKVTRVLTTVVLGGMALAASGALWMMQVPDGGPVGRAEAQQQQDIEFIDNGRLLSGAVRVGRTLYLSGQLGLGGERGITPETRAAMENIKTLLEANGATMDDVVKCTVFLADFAEWGAMNDVYLSYFEKHRPARSAIAVNGMAANARVEIECIAVVGARNAD
ncbi:MAG TPA: RidA family protein [Longimicrobiales bacterium]|nr:RidA family protein [Longimicrobiales bacterium]